MNNNDHSSDDDYEEENHQASQKPQNGNRAISSLTDDTAREIIDIEFNELEDWLKSESRKLKYECYEIADSLQVKKEV